jgi:hypothetical protein
MRQMAHLSQLDTILNSLDDLKKSIDTALDSAKKANNTALVSKLQNAETTRKAFVDSIATFVRGEGTEDETKLREDVFSAYGVAQGLVTPAVANFLVRVDAEYRAGIGQYNAFVTGSMPGITAALKEAGVKSLPSVKTVMP